MYNLKKSVLATMNNLVNMEVFILLYWDYQKMAQYWINS